MAETTTIHAQLIRYSTDGNQIIVNLKNTAADVSIDVSKNTKVPAAATDLQSLVGVLGKLAFADTIADATTSASGLMTAAMVTKLNGIAAGANAYTHPNSGVTAGTYKSVTVNAQGHVTAGSNPTTLAGYGITDAASKNHTHKIADLTDNIPASKITGVLSLDNIPKSAVERVVPVTDDAARLKLTNADVQNGDVVKVTSTGQMYFVVDDTKLTTEAGYMVFSAGSAASVPWSGVSGKPSSMPASDVYAWAKAASKPSYSKSEVGLGNVDNTADSAKSVKYAASAGSAGSAGSATKATQDSAGQQINTTYIKSLSVSGRTITFTKGDNTTGSITTQDTNTTYGTFTKATADAAGGTGLVPAPAKGQQGLYLRGDGTWATPTNTTYGDATTSSHGLMTAAMVSKLNGIANGANAYSHPGYTARTAGLYKITVDGTGHVSAVTAVGKADITALGIPGSDTNTWRPLGTTADTACAGNDSRLSNARPASDVSAWAKAASKPSYSWGEISGKPSTFSPSSHSHAAATGSAAGFMSATDKSKLDLGEVVYVSKTAPGKQCIWIKLD